jgi:outer membrane protein W
MRILRQLLIISCVIFVFAVTLTAQPLNRLSRIELRLGMWTQTTEERTAVSDEGSTLTAESGGFQGGVAYSYYMKENLAITFVVNIQVVDVEAEVSRDNFMTETAYLTPVLVNLRWYFPGSSSGKSLRPYLVAGPGLFVGQQSRSESETAVLVASKSSMAFGGYFGAGIDLRLGDLFAVGATGGYNLMGDFSEPIGGSVNYSGMEFAMSFSFLFGPRGE